MKLLLPFYVVPHYAEAYTPKVTDKALEECANRLGAPIYGIDDDSAIAVSGDKIEIYSEGKWKLFN